MTVVPTEFVGTPAEEPAAEVAVETEATEAVEAPAEEAAVETEKPAEDPIWEQRMAQFTKINGDQQTQIETMKAELAEYTEFKRLRENNPLEAMSKVGLDPSDITNKFLGVDAEEEDAMVTMQKQLKASDDRFKAYEQAQTDKVNEQSIATFKTQIGSTISDSGSKYELCSTVGNEAIENAWIVVEKHHENTGEVMDINVALGHVEAFYEQQYKTLATKRGQKAPIQDSPELKETSTQSPTTLTQSAVANAPSTTKPVYRSTEDSLAAAAKLLEFT